MHPHIGALGVYVGTHTAFVSKAVGYGVLYPQGGEIQTLQGAVLRSDFHAKTLLGREPHFPCHATGGVVNVVLTGIRLVRQLNQHPHA